MTEQTATERLRAMLDERGVEWTKPKSATEFIQTTFLCNGWGIEVLERNIGLCVTATNAFDTPEQAIAATLGNDGVERSNDGVAERRTCKNKATNSRSFWCANCDCALENWMDVGGTLVNGLRYCPYCGAEVVK